MNNYASAEEAITKADEAWNRAVRDGIPPVVVKAQTELLRAIAFALLAVADSRADD